jgi:5-methyltetrahydropteroyltriglutamate--homocysteine methyltransferase
VSIETAQSNLDCAVLTGLANKKIILGVIDLSTNDIESPDLVATRIRRALTFVNAADVIIAPDCGMKYLPREVAFGKLQAMVGGAQIVRSQLEREQATAAQPATSK